MIPITESNLENKGSVQKISKRDILGQKDHFYLIEITIAKELLHCFCFIESLPCITPFFPQCNHTGNDLTVYH